LLLISSIHPVLFVAFVMVLVMVLAIILASQILLRERALLAPYLEADHASQIRHDAIESRGCPVESHLTLWHALARVDKLAMELGVV